MTRKEQRSLITRFAASGLGPMALALLKELVTASWAGKNHFAVAEMPFEISLNKLAIRTNMSRETIIHNLEILREKGLLSVIKGKPGTVNHYLLNLLPLETWESSVAYKNRLKRE